MEKCINKKLSIDKVVEYRDKLTTLGIEIHNTKTKIDGYVSAIELLENLMYVIEIREKLKEDENIGVKKNVRKNK